jgi:aldose 1-epimerase
VSADGDRLIGVAGGPLEVEILPSFGARLHRLRAYGQDLLRTPDDPGGHRDDPYFWGSYPMAPWCNRLPAGPATAAGNDIDLPVSFPDGTAIHGQVSQAAWQIVAADADQATFRIEGGGDGWPWRYEVEQRVWIDEAAVGLALRLTNHADSPMPGGIGFHPWFRKPVRLAIAAALVHPSNLGTLAEPVPVSGRLDRHVLDVLDEGIDATWAELGEPPVVLDWPAVGIRAAMTVDSPEGPPPFIVAAAIPGIDAIAVEGQTHAPDGLRRLARDEPGAMGLIDPGATLEMSIVLTFERTA